jgi:hypothetical protein
MPKPGVVTIPLPPQLPAQSSPTVIAAGPPKTIQPDVMSPERLLVQHGDVVVRGDRVTIHGLSTMRAGLILTNAQVTVEP